jgi:hypothetical protein
MHANVCELMEMGGESGREETMTCDGPKSYSKLYGDLVVVFGLLLHLRFKLYATDNAVNTNQHHQSTSPNNTYLGEIYDREHNHGD